MNAFKSPIPVLPLRDIVVFPNMIVRLFVGREKSVLALEEVMIDLAQQIVKDGEGASKFITVHVRAAETDTDARTIAFAIANSPLVKTALFASDPNWGRILAAIGRAGLEDLDTDSVSIHLNGVLIAEQGARAAS